jgi:hypothetical protein
MVWQDVVITLANIAFTYSLIHQVFHGFKTKKAHLTLTAAALTSLGLYATSFCFFTLGLISSGVTIAINGTLWLILLVQTLKYGSKK